MAHYAFLNDNNIVTEVITGVDEDAKDTLPEGFDSWEEWYADFRGQTCKRTSYNTAGNEHSGEGTAYRGNYAGIGYTYDSENDVFYAPKPFPSGFSMKLLGLGKHLKICQMMVKHTTGMIIKVNGKKSLKNNVK